MNKFKSISAIMMAMLVLLASSGFAVNMHFCCGEVQDVAIVVKANPCSGHFEPVIEQKNRKCCEDISYKIDTDSHTVSQSVSLEKADFVKYLINLHYELNITAHYKLSKNLDHQYTPPLVARDITVWVQTFLI